MKKLFALFAFIALILGFVLFSHSNGPMETPPQLGNLADAPSDPAEENLSQTESAPRAEREVRKFPPTNAIAAAAGLTPKDMQAVRQEIKMSLSAIYAAQKSFHSEYGRYSTDLHAVGFQPEKISVKYGFLRPFSPRALEGREDPRFLDTDALVSTSAGEKRLEYEGKVKTWDLSLSDYQSHCRRGCTASANHFELIAAAQLVEGNPPEIWLINEKKELKQVQDGSKPR